MNLDMVIQQIRTLCPAFESRVSGAADFAQGVEATSTSAMPAAFVLPLSDEARDPEDPNMPGMWQTVVERIGVVVQISNQKDRRGQGSVTSVYDLRTQLFRALLNWRPGITQYGGPEPDAERPVGMLASATGFSYSGGSLLSFDRARLFWQFEFDLKCALSDADGFLVTGHTLDSIDVHITNPSTGEDTGLGAIVQLEK